MFSLSIKDAQSQITFEGKQNYGCEAGLCKGANLYFISDFKLTGEQGTSIMLSGAIINLKSPFPEYDEVICPNLC